MTEEERVASALANMTAEERVEARARASKGWSGDFTRTFRRKKRGDETNDSNGDSDANGAGDAGSGSADGGFSSAGSLPPTWTEKPKNAAGSAIEAKTLKNSSSDPADLAVEFIGGNAAELAFRALHPDAPAPARVSPPPLEPPPPPTRAEDARTGGGLDPGGADAVERAKEVLEVQFFGPNADELAFRAVFPEATYPGGANANTNTKNGAAASEKASDANAAAEAATNRGPGADGPRPGTTRLPFGLEPGEPFAHVTGAAGLSVEFIGANAAALTRAALGLDDDDDSADEEEAEEDDVADAAKVWSSDADVRATAESLPATPERSDQPPDGSTAAARSASSPPPPSQAAAWANASVAVSSAAAATVEAVKAAVEEHAASDAATPAIVSANASDLETVARMVTRTEAKAAEVARDVASLASAADALLAGDAARAEALAEAEGATWAEGAGEGAEGAERTNPWVPPAAEALIRGETTPYDLDVEQEEER